MRGAYRSQGDATRGGPAWRSASTTSRAGRASSPPRKPERSTFLPEPERQPRHVHADLGRRPPRRAARTCSRAACRRSSPTLAPRVEIDDDGHGVLALRRRSATTRSGSTRWSAGRCEERSFEPTRFDEMRRGAWDIDARVHDMDLNGVYASLNFPSSLAGFAGQRYQLGVSRPRAGARRRARGERLAPRGVGGHLPRPHHPAARCRGCSTPRSAAEEIRAQRGARVPGGHVPRAARAARPAVAAHRLLGSVPRRVRGDRAPSCACTSGRRRPRPTTSSDAPADTIGVLFFGWAMFAAVDWLYSKLPVRFPDLQHLPVGGRHRLGGRAARPARPRRPLPGDVRHVGRHRASPRAR